MLKAWLNPKIRIVFFWVLLNAAWMLAAWEWVERENWLWVIPIALSINCLLFTYDQVLTFRMLVGHPITGNDAWGVLKIVHDLAEELRVKPPQVFLIPRPSAQIFTYSKRRGHTRLFITQGLLDLLTPRQLAAALTFQMLSIRSSYALLNYWIAAALDLVDRVGKAMERAIRVVFGYAPPVAVGLLAPLIWMSQKLLLGTRDFSKLDAETVRVLEGTEDLAYAIWKMEAYARTRPWNEAWIFAHMCMVSPLNLKPNYAFLQVQPLMKSRIKSLTGRYPL